MVDKYRQAFQEEARELLQDLESALLLLIEQQGDRELVARVFRALHTIKGSGAMFGFDDIAAFTHHLENAFDEVRNGRLTATPDLINLALAAVDQNRAMLDEAAGGMKADAVAAAQILEKLRALTGTPGPVATSSKAPTDAPVARAQTCTGLTQDWSIQFRPKPDLLRNGANPLLLFRELRQMGSLQITADTSAVPPLAELGPQCCYLSWNMVLTTAASYDEVRDVFIFVEDNCDLVIGAAPTAPQPSPAGQVAAPADAPVERRSGDGRRTTDKEQGGSIRVASAKLDQLVDLVGELVTVQARLGEIAYRSQDRDMQAVAEEIERLTSALRETSMGMRTLPMRSTFERMRRLVYDLGRALEKEVELCIEGGETELDKTVIDHLNDPLMHLVRNCMDHGLETTSERSVSGKSRAGTIRLAARHVGAQVFISISDDGRGINKDAVRARAIERRLVSADARLTDSEIFSFILAPGFSTAQQVTDISGRGVGMDVVRRNVEALRGTIDISSTPGAGTTVTLRLPLTLAIIDGLLVRVGHGRFVMPLANTVECVELTRQDVENANGKHLANIRGEVIPYVRLSEYLHVQADPLEREQLMVAETEHGRFGFVVDEVLGDHQTVIKNLGRLYRDVHTVSGATILGDGTVALILDLHRMAQDAIQATSVKQHSHARAPCPGRPMEARAAAASSS